MRKLFPLTALLFAAACGAITAPDAQLERRPLVASDIIPMQTIAIDTTPVLCMLAITPEGWTDYCQFRVDTLEHRGQDHPFGYWVVLSSYTFWDPPLPPDMPPEPGPVMCQGPGGQWYAC